jgi:glycosyltransferase involved in cell wall biosynthesis
MSFHGFVSDMVAERRVLLVLFEGLADTVVDSAVLDHTRQAAERGVAFEIWAFCCTGESYRRSLAGLERARRLAGWPIRVRRGVRPAVPFSVFLNRLLLGWTILRDKPGFDIVHARTDYSAVVAAAAKAMRKAVLVWDCRGDSAAEAVERLKRRRWLPSFVRHLKRRRAERERALAARCCDRAMFVSEPLAQLCAPLLSGKPATVIPCAASEDLFFYDPALRARMRRELGYRDGDRVYVYSGSLVSYQCFDEMASLFQAWSAADPQARLLVLTPDADAARQRLAHLDPDAARVTGAQFDTVNDYLNAADAAFMLRRPSLVNRVASPTKFAEYCLTGLPVIMTDAVEEAWRTSGELGNRVKLEGGIIEWPVAFDRAEVARRAQGLLGKRHLASRYDQVYALGEEHAGGRGAVRRRSA